MRWLSWPLLLMAAFLAGCLPDPDLPAPEVSIEPTEPTSDDDLTLVMDELPTNLPGLVAVIGWEVDDEPVAELDDATLVPAAQTAAGERWTVRAHYELDVEVGSDGTDSVVIQGAFPDDDDVVDDDDSGAPDDDDVGPDDDDVGPDDDDAVEPAPPTSRLCASAGTSTSATFSLTTCTGPMEIAPGVSSSASYTLVLGTFRVLQGQEDL